MKALLVLAALVIPAVAAAEDCHWAGGSFHGEKVDFQAHFTVNADCTDMVFESSGSYGIQEQDVPQTFALVNNKHGWVADINGVDATLARQGTFVNFVGKGINTRVQMRPAE